MSSLLSNKKTDKEGYNEFYKDKASQLLQECDTPEEYIKLFGKRGLSPFADGGNTKGYVRGLAVQKLIESSDLIDVPRNRLTILDAGCGLGELSVYLACQGFSVVGVDVSTEACEAAEKLSQRIGVSENCLFLAESLEDLSLADSSVDFIIGHASLHHFIKYDVPKEFYRIMKKGAKGFFADGFGENRIYHIFHDKEKMERLGDVSLTKELIESYFSCFKVSLIPTDWFVMLDKLYLRVVPRRFEKYIRRLSKVHFWLDRKLPKSNRASLFLSGSVMTTIEKN
jgi:SAM-dependent methyltransferase